jgi:CDP-glucose 4,6-dehydratase
VARCGNIYGGGDLNWSRLVPGTLRRALEGQPPLLRSDGRYTRDYIYVEDVVDAYLALAEGAPRPGIRGEAFNFSPEQSLSVLEMARLLLEVVGRGDLEPIIQNVAQAEIRDQVLDASKARRLLDWSPRHTLREGLLETAAWYRAFLEGAP